MLWKDSQTLLLISPGAGTQRHPGAAPCHRHPRMEPDHKDSTGEAPKCPRPVAGTSPAATGRCLNKGALVANPVCRFTSSLIPSNRSRLSPVLGRVRAAVSESGVHLDGARQGSNTNTSHGRIIKEPVVNEHLLQPSRGCRAPVIWAPGLSECRCTDPRAPGILQSSPSIAPPGCSGGAARPSAPPQPLHG